MNKEEVVSAAVMTVVSAMVLIGITVAWYTLTSNPTVTGLQLFAAEPGTIKIALQSEADAISGGKTTSDDVADLAKDGIYADIGIDELAHVGVENSTVTGDELNGKQKGQMAPGAFGKITFYLTPTDKSITECDILSVVAMQDTTNDTGYYGDEDGETGVAVDGDSEYTIAELFTLTNQHIEFYYYSDNQMTQKVKIDAENPMKLTWAENELMTEKKVDLYWEWHYEYPFTDEEKTSLTDEEKTEKIFAYDKVDAVIGNNISEMRFHFKFGIK